MSGRGGWACLVLLGVGVLAGCMMEGAASSTPTPEAVSATAAPAAIIFDSATLPPVMALVQREPRLCPDAPPPRLIVGERGRVTDNNDESLNIRTSPGTQHDQIGRLPPGAIFRVTGGPRCEGDFVWFYIRYQGLEGWIAEGDEEERYTEPYLGG